MSRGLSPPSCSALQIAALSPVGTVRYRVALSPYPPLVSPFSAGNSLGMLLVPQCLWELRNLGLGVQLGVWPKCHPGLRDFQHG